MAASTASACLRSDCDLVHSQSRSQACWRETSACMAVTLAQRSRPTPIPRISLPARPVGAPPIPMEKFVIEGGVPLSGTIVPAGNKNGVLPILAACLLTEDEVVLRNVPRIADAEAMALLLETLGATVEWLGPGEVSVNASGVDRYDVDRELAERIRASFLLAGPLLARFGHAHMPLPGAWRDRGARSRHLHPGAARSQPVRLPDGRTVRDGDRERAHGRRPDPRAHGHSQRGIRAARPGSGPDAGGDGSDDRRDRLQRDDRPWHGSAPRLHPHH